MWRQCMSADSAQMPSMMPNNNIYATKVHLQPDHNYRTLSHQKRHAYVLCSDMSRVRTIPYSDLFGCNSTNTFFTVNCLQVCRPNAIWLKRYWLNNVAVIAIDTVTCQLPLSNASDWFGDKFRSSNHAHQRTFIRVMCNAATHKTILIYNYS